MKVRTMLLVLATVVAPFSYARGSQESFSVANQTMVPLIQPGSHVIVDKEYYNTHSVQPGDLVVVHLALANVTLAKKVLVVGPGLLVIRNEDIEFNGKEIQDNDVYYDSALLGQYYFSDKELSFELKQGEYFFINNNWYSYKDSRVFGPLGLDEIVGKIVRIE